MPLGPAGLIDDPAVRDKVLAARAEHVAAKGPVGSADAACADYPARMGELAVRRDGAFYGVTIRAVLDSGATAPLYVAIRAQRVEWHAPDDPLAGSDGWVRTAASDAVEGELELFFTRDKVHARALAQLAGWQADPPSKLVGVSSIDEQYVGLIDQDQGVGIGIKLTDAEQERSSSRAYATWSRGRLRGDSPSPSI